MIYREEDESESLESLIGGRNTTRAQPTGETDGTQFSAAFERQELDPYCDTLYPTVEEEASRDFSTLDDRPQVSSVVNHLLASDSAAAVVTNISTVSAPAEGSFGFVDRNDDSSSEPHLNDDIFHLKRRTHSEDGRGREHLYGERHSLFGLGTVLLTFSQIRTRGKRKRTHTPPEDVADETALRAAGSSDEKFLRQLRSGLAQQSGRSRKQWRADTTEEPKPDSPKPSQPLTKPISQEQLVAEVKEIYAGLVMVESKCIEIDNAQLPDNSMELNQIQWETRLAIHRTILLSQLNFLLARQHPVGDVDLMELDIPFEEDHPSDLRLTEMVDDDESEEELESNQGILTLSTNSSSLWLPDQDLSTDTGGQPRQPRTSTDSPDVHSCKLSTPSLSEAQDQGYSPLHTAACQFYCRESDCSQTFGRQCDLK